MWISIHPDGPIDGHLINGHNFKCFIACFGVVYKIYFAFKCIDQMVACRLNSHINWKIPTDLGVISISVEKDL